MELIQLIRQNKRQIASMLLLYMGLTLWMGSIGFFGIGVAGTVFKVIDSRDLAGTLNRSVLSRLSIVELAALILILPGLLLHNLRIKGWQAKIPFVLFMLMTLIFAGYAHYITGIMDEMLASISSFDKPAPGDGEAIYIFNVCHKWYSSLVQLNLLLGFILFIWQTCLYGIGHDAKPSATSAPIAQ